MIRLLGLTKRFGDLTAVHDLNLHVRRGELFGFLGPNGAGKTTTLKILAGLLRPTSGKALIGGFDVVREPLLAKALLGYVPDRPFVYRRLTAEEFLRFYSSLHRVEPRLAERRMQELLDLFDLTPWRHEWIEAFSHGMAQKLCLCAALLPKPQVLVIDEPMVGLDPQSARLLREVFRALCRSGATVFLSTHDLHVVETLCDRVAILHRGSLSGEGSPQELRRQAEEEGGTLESVFLKLTGGHAAKALDRLWHDDGAPP